MAVITTFIRFSPFIIFKNHTPKPILYLGEVLPYAIMGMLVVYCLKGVSFISYPYGIPEVIAMVLVVSLHKWKHNALLSIFTGTAIYMILLQVIFK